MEGRPRPVAPRRSLHERCRLARQSPETSSGLGTQKTLAIVAGGVGLVGLGLGSVFGLMTISKKNDAQSACPNLCSTQDGVTQRSDTKSAGNTSTVAFIVGGVAGTKR